MAPTFERSRAASAPMTVLGSPGAPGWTMGGAAPPDDVRQAAPIAAASRQAATGNHNLLICIPSLRW